MFLPMTCSGLCLMVNYLGTSKVFLQLSLFSIPLTAVGKGTSILIVLVLGFCTLAAGLRFLGA